MTEWRVFYKEVTTSTNVDALGGRHGDVFTAGFQTAGKGRLGHKWLSSKGKNLVMSAVLDVSRVSLEHSVTFPLVCGLATARALSRFSPDAAVSIKWPNDVWVRGAKIAGILCERHGDNVTAGIGVNVLERRFPQEIASRATSLTLLTGAPVSVNDVRDAVLEELSSLYDVWVDRGFEVVYGELSAMDFLKGRKVRVRQSDDDLDPVEGVCGGILVDGSLDVAGERVYAGEAHVEEMW